MLAKRMPSFKPKELWEAKPHTLAKIEIIRRYLYLWFSIRKANTKLSYIDGFAGPGKYSNSDESSPLAALQAAKAATENFPRLTETELNFLFIEKKHDFIENLQSVVSAIQWPANIKLQIQQGTFDEKVGGILTDLRKQGNKLPPTFAFIDPFGATGLPFRVIAEILSYPGCEILIN